ncbi:MAG: hypothetical protein U0528_03185 [Anaerolineae bacterium]
MAGMSGMGGGFSAAEKLNIPFIQAFVMPLTPTSSYPSPLTPTLPAALGGLLNCPSFHLMRQMLWQTVRVGEISTCRELGMKRPSMWGPYRHLRQQRTPILYGYSQHVVPRPDDWDEMNQVTGYWFLDAPQDYTTRRTGQLLEAGTPPIYIGFGSMANRSPEDTARLAIQALQLSGQRCAGVRLGWYEQRRATGQRLYARRPA